MIIYLCTNELNGKRYVGLTSISLNRRKSNHKTQAFTLNSQSKFHRALRKYGIDSFKWEVLDDKSLTVEELITKEIEYIERFDTYKSGYNMTIGGDGAVGSIHTEEWKKQQSKRSKRFHQENENHKKWLALSLEEKYGKKANNIRSKMSQSGKSKLQDGKRTDLTEYSRDKMSSSKMKDGNPNYVSIPDNEQNLIITLYKQHGRILPIIEETTGYSNHVIKRFLKEINLYAGRKKYQDGPNCS